MFGVDFLLKISSFILLPFYLAYMTQEEYGMYSYLFVIISSSALFLSFGFHVPEMKLYHSYKKIEDKKSFLFTINLILLIIISVLFFILVRFNIDVFLIDYLIDYKIDYFNYRPYFLGLIFMSIFNLMQYSFFITNQDLNLVKGYNLLRLIFINGVVLYFLANSDIDAVLIRLKYSFFVQVLIFLSLSFFFIRNMNLKFSTKFLKKIFKIGTPIMLSGLVYIFYNLSDKFFLEKYHDLKLLGEYSLGLALCSVIPLSMASFHTVFSPIIFKEKNNIKNFNVTNKIARICFWLYVVVGLCLILALFFLIKLSFIDEAYFNVIYFLPIMIFGSIFFALSQLYQLILTNIERTDIGFIFNILTTLICICFCYFLVPDYAAYGASISVLIATFLSFLFHFYYIKHKIC